MTTTTIVAVTTNLECAHRSASGAIHGHSYVIEVWFPSGPDLEELAVQVSAVAREVDHTLLEDSIGAPSMEEIGRWFLTRVAAARVVVRRPTLGFIVEVTRQ